MDTQASESKKSLGSQSKLVKLAMEMDSENQMLKGRNTALETEVTALKERVSNLEAKLKEFEPSLESVGGSFLTPKKKSFVVTIFSMLAPNCIL